MKMSTKQKITILVTLMLIDLFMGLRSETIEARSPRFSITEHKIFFYNYCVGNVAVSERPGQPDEKTVSGLGELSGLGHYKYYISIVIALIGIIFFIKQGQENNKGDEQ